MHFKYSCLLVLLLIVNKVTAQNGGTTDTSKRTFNFAEQMPVADYSLPDFLGSNIIYPDSARKHHIEGRVVLKFVVNEDGHISNCIVIKSVNPYLDAEALRVVQMMPPWKPGIQQGKPVKVYFTLPISFKLE